MLPPRARVIIDNDFAGDPDDLFQLAHHLLSPSVTVPFVICSALQSQPHDERSGSVDRGIRRAQRMLDLLGADVALLRGSEGTRTSARQHIGSEASEAIVAEAMRDDTDLPLFICLGGGLTEIADAYLQEPAIADRLTVVWIGGPGYDESEPDVPSYFGAEYNMQIDIVSARTVFESPLPLWQVPRDSYRECLVAWSELRARIGGGPIGDHLLAELDAFVQDVRAHGFNLGETYVLGDNPLVLLTALQSSFDPDPSSSRSEQRARPIVGDSGWYIGTRTDLPPVRVFSHCDTRLMFEDLFAKICAADGRLVASTVP